MSEKPILFNTDMVKAILEGRKTVTRRIIKDVNNMDFIGYVTCSVPKGDEGKAAFGKGNIEDISNSSIKEYKKPPCRIGDILYVRETWSTQYNGIDDDNGYGEYVYKANGTILDNSEGNSSKWKPSIHMPKLAARIFLKVTNVRAERLQDITDEEALMEGIQKVNSSLYGVNEKTDITKQCLYAKKAFSHLWDSTIKRNGLDSYSFNANPWVWVIEFEKIEKEYK